jgi:hypothetical protein
MRAFTCERCGQLLFFENSLCLRCGAELGFVPSQLTMIALELHPPGGYRRCANAGLTACNWVLEPDDAGPLCRSCERTRTRPSDSDGEGLRQFRVAEAAKRRLLFGLLDLGVPIGEELGFDLLSSRAGAVTTGHAYGLVTIDVAESDDARREARRAELGEPYRTLLGHFRHEVGHYCWPILVGGEPALGRARALFGDEREDYQAALERHYQEGPPPDWPERHVSAYATMHPFEDWAETFAHYLHIRDTLQTAGAFGIVVAGPEHSDDLTLTAAPEEDVGRRPMQSILSDWFPLTYALNAVNRSMGRDDLYPFALAATVTDKLSFVHDRVLAVAQATPLRPLAG